VDRQPDRAGPREFLPKLPFSTSSSSLSSLANRRRSGRAPPRNALVDEIAFPSAVRGPVERVHRRQRSIALACFAPRAAVQPFAIVRLPKFVGAISFSPRTTDRVGDTARGLGAADLRCRLGPDWRTGLKVESTLASVVCASVALTHHR